jgi:hypothetical protein
MSVTPPGPGQIGGSGLRRSRQTSGETQIEDRARGAARSRPRSEDSIEISETAEELGQTSSASGPTGLDDATEWLPQVLTRISDGFYHRPEVRAEVARRLGRVLGIS